MAHPRHNGHLFLCRAIERGDKNTARTLIWNGVGVNNAQLNNGGLLHSAIIKFDDLDIMRMLLDKGANIYAKDHHNNKPLHVAIQNNKTEAASLLIRRGALVGENLDLLLLTTIEKSNHTIFEMLINHRMQNNPSNDLKTLFNAAISQGNSKIIQHIIPYCQFSESFDKYIPKELVIKPGLQYKENIEMLLRWNFTINPNSRHDEDFICTAVANGHLQIILQLLNTGIDVNMVNSNTKLSLLTIACSNKHHQIVENLIQHGADINVMIPADDLLQNNKLNFFQTICNFNHFLFLTDVGYNLCDVTCLHIAVFNADPIMTEILLKNGAKIKDDQEFFFITCLAAYINNEEIIRIFLNHGLRVNLIDLQGKILLRRCVYSNSDEKDSCYGIAKLLLKKGANVHLHTPGNTFVYEAMKNGHCRIVELFLYYEADVQYISPDGDTSLHKAIENHSNVEFIKTLLKLKSPVDIINSNGLTPLLVACKIQSDNQFKIIKTLLQYNANVNCADINLRTPLHSACDAQNSRLVKVLLEKGANPNVANVEGKTSLHLACKSQSSETLTIIQLLLENNADVDVMDADGWTPLFIACYSCNEIAVKCLLDNHAYVNHTDLQNLTPLHIAVEQKSIEMTKTLIKSGANVSIVDKNNQTALQIAVELYRVLKFTEGNDHHLNRMNNYKEIIKFLKAQVVKLAVAGLKVNDEDQKIVYNPSYNQGGGRDLVINIRQLETKCQQEINKMNIASIGIIGMTDNITFYDLLKKDIRFLRKFVNNEDIQKTLELQVYDTRYPLYIDIVRDRFRDVKLRYEVMNSAGEYFSEHVCQRMPDHCIDAVFSYLSIGELKMFIEGMKLLSGWSIIKLPEVRIDSDHK